ncbi:nucleotide exchange factor GrpE [Anaeromicrobium sediminis]|uniref:Protein GrpE n=1 Tax=Anaeromicrobium sediminis TaxID=1478221 RepID=A0A267MH97_9FIRM|nr:nucleotide exchange factor GrpE [Anaeromicrobium sediminis]PAB58941.1 nucleotide exchange factor GrpE [Anaeromicrobium sediminis]
MENKNVQEQEEVEQIIEESEKDSIEEDIEEAKNINDGLEKIQQENEELNGKYLRMTADFQNFKRRVEKEKGDIYKLANEKLIVDLLPILDNLERAINSHKSDIKDESFFNGVDMILKQFVDVLGKNGLEAIEAIGKEFDPNYHHAVMQDSSDDVEPDTIMEEFQKGYVLNDKVIRPSMVKVIK